MRSQAAALVSKSGCDRAHGLGPTPPTRQTEWMFCTVSGQIALEIPGRLLLRPVDHEVFDCLSLVCEALIVMVWIFIH